MITNPVAPAPKRKGSLRMADIPPEVIAGLNAGELEAVTLVESLSVDYCQLLQAVAPDIGADTIRQMREAQMLKITGRMKASGDILHTRYGLKGIEKFARHRSDTVRGWAAAILSVAPKLTLKQRLTHIADLADDPNAGLREWSWMALRPHIIAELDLALKLLEPWTHHASANLRRFASEATRPRGVWCAHIEVLKQEPQHALHLLDPLHSDPSRYVQNSVANWLNDAGKSQPDFVHQTCARWQKQSKSKETQYIVKRAKRNFE